MDMDEIAEAMLRYKKEKLRRDRLVAIELATVWSNEHKERSKKDGSRAVHRTHKKV